MSLKSVKEKYETLLKSFSDLGVKINESQKESLDGFIQDYEKTLNEQRDSAIRKTSEIVTEKLGKEYKEVVESIIKHQKEHSELAGKVQKKVVELNESNKIADAVDSYLDAYVEEVLPKKTIVDYTRMQKLEKIQESLKEMLSVSEADVNSKANEVKNRLEKKNNELTEKISAYEKQISESKKELSKLKAKDFVSEKIKDLPVVESKMILKKTEGMSFDEVKKNYKTILESVQDAVKAEQEVKEDEKNLEEAITDILEGKKKEASSEKTSDKDVEGTESTPETTDGEEEVAPEEDDEPSSVQITESQMQSWIETLNRITPKK